MHYPLLSEKLNVDQPMASTPARSQWRELGLGRVLSIIAMCLAPCGCGWRFGAPPVGLSLARVEGNSVEEGIVEAVSSAFVQHARQSGLGPGASVIARVGDIRVRHESSASTASAFSLSVQGTFSAPSLPGCRFAGEGIGVWSLSTSEELSPGVGRDVALRTAIGQLAARAVDALSGNPSCAVRTASGSPR